MAPEASNISICATESGKQRERKNAAIACESCRKKRIRCIVEADGNKCKTCAVTGLECIFSGLDRRKESIVEVKARLAHLEDVFAKLKSSAPDNHALDEIIASLEVDAAGTVIQIKTDQQPMSDGLQSRKKRRPNPPLAEGAELDIADILQTSRPTASPPIALNLGGVIDRLAVENEGIRAYGPTSNHGLAYKDPVPLDEVGEATSVDGLVCAPAQQSQPASTECSLLVAAAHNIGSIPLGTDIRAVEHLIMQYFTWHHPIFPVMSRKIFLDRFCKGSCSPLLLNAMLAIASHLTDWTMQRYEWTLPNELTICNAASSIRSDPADPSTSGATFFAMAKSLLDAELEHPSLTTVQALCLMAKHEAYNGRALKGGLYIAMCGRLVLDLGLHLDPRQLMERGVLAAEESWLRSRTFWGIWSVDKEFSALVGRPSAIRDIVVTCPKPAYWEAEDFDWWATYRAKRFVPISSDRSQGVHYLADHAMEMAGVHLRAMDKMYWRESKALLEENLEALEVHMLETRSAIAKLPSILPDPTGAINPHKVTLRMVYECHIIILNRPFLFASGIERADLGPLQPNISVPRQRCFDSAMEIVRLMSAIATATEKGILSTLNCHQHNLVTAAAILILETTPSMNIATGPALLQRSREAELALTTVFNLLEDMASFRPAAKTALENLRDMLQKRKTQDQLQTVSTALVASQHQQDTSSALIDHSFDPFAMLDTGSIFNTTGTDFFAADFPTLPDFDTFFAQQQSYLYPTLGMNDGLDSTLFFQAQMLQSRPQSPR